MIQKPLTPKVIKEALISYQSKHIVELEAQVSKDKNHIDNLCNSLDEANRAKRKLEDKFKLIKRLLLLTHPAVSDKVMNDLTQKQWVTFVAAFPEEGETQISETEE